MRQAHFIRENNLKVLKEMVQSKSLEKINFSKDKLIFLYKFSQGIFDQHFAQFSFNKTGFNCLEII